MIEEFINDIKNTYNEILEVNNIKTLKNFKKRWDIKESIGDYYEDILEKSTVKYNGRVYTSIEVVDNINKKVIENISINKNYKSKVLDPSCGGGYFLKNLYKKLEIYLKETNIKNIPKHIIENMLYGYDIDEIAIIITKLELFELSGYISKNIIKMDFLIEDNKKYNYIIGNPPYIGHKYISKDYRNDLKDRYSDVFYDKGDISYCFIKKSINSLKNKGRLIIFTSRYFMEALNGRGIRKYIKNKGSLVSIIDFYGVRILKKAHVDNIILEFIKENGINKLEYFKIKPTGKNMGIKVFESINNEDNIYYNKLTINDKKLSLNGWKFLEDNEISIIDKIEKMCKKRISDIAESYQGIITGKDEAFIVENKNCQGIEKEVLRPWIKSCYINKFKIKESKSKIIYSTIIKKEEEFKGALNHLLPYKEALEKRRECIRKSKAWYEVQWARKSDIFDGEKIVFPYKSSRNRFAIDKGNYFSADVYCIKIKDNYKKKYTYEFLESILNSRIYEFYIKTKAKKLGEGLYEYYPNKIMSIKIPCLIDDVCSLYKKDSTNIENIDKVLCEFFNITCDEYNIICKWCSPLEL